MTRANALRTEIRRAWADSWALTATALVMLATFAASVAGIFMDDWKAPAQIGAHTVGAPDGGPGLPGVGWSLEHGDLRIPHFLGLHALQVFPFLGRATLRRRPGRNPNAVAFTGAASYLGFVGILVWQALRGQAVIAPDASTVLALLVWLDGCTTWRSTFLSEAGKRGTPGNGESPIG